jgi:hypothetical protein
VVQSIQPDYFIGPEIIAGEKTGRPESERRPKLPCRVFAARQGQEANRLERTPVGMQFRCQIEELEKQGQDRTGRDKMTCDWRQNVSRLRRVLA